MVGMVTRGKIRQDCPTHRCQFRNFDKILATVDINMPSLQGNKDLFSDALP